MIDDEDDAGGGNAFAAQLRRRAAKREQNAAAFEPKLSESEVQWKKVSTLRRSFYLSAISLFIKVSRHIVLVNFLVNYIFKEAICAINKKVTIFSRQFHFTLFFLFCS